MRLEDFFIAERIFGDVSRYFEKEVDEFVEFGADVGGDDALDVAGVEADADLFLAEVNLGGV